MSDISSLPVSIFCKIREFILPLYEGSNRCLEQNSFEFKNWRNFLRVTKSIWKEIGKEYNFLNIKRSVSLSDFKQINDDAELWSKEIFAVNSSRQQVFLNFSPRGNLISFPTEPEYPYDELLAQEGLKPFNVYGVYIQTVCLLVDLHPFCNVTYFYLCDCPSITDVSPLKNVPLVHFYSCKNIRDVSSLSNCRRLLLDDTAVSDVSHLGKVKNLCLSHSHFIDDVSALKNVNYLEIDSCAAVKKFPNFEGTLHFQFTGATSFAKHKFDLTALNNIPYLSLQSWGLPILYSNGLPNDACFTELTLSGCNSSILSTLASQNIKKLIISESLPRNYEEILQGFENIQFSFLNSCEEICVLPSMKSLRVYRCLKVSNITVANSSNSNSNSYSHSHSNVPTEVQEITSKQEYQLKELSIQLMGIIPKIDFLSFPNLQYLYLHDSGKGNTSRLSLKHVQPMKSVYLENCDIYMFDIYQSIEKFQIIKGKCYSRVHGRTSIKLYQKAKINKILVDGKYSLEEIAPVTTAIGNTAGEGKTSCRIN
jgi:hypothetical protein